MAQVFLSDRIWCQVVALYCSCATALAITNVIIVNNFVDNINSKYIVAVAMSHPTANMAHTRCMFHEMRKVKKLSTSFMLTSGCVREVVYHILREYRYHYLECSGGSPK